LMRSWLKEKRIARPIVEELHRKYMSVISREQSYIR
jgi:uncharacterized protein YlxP (DUF503 family)